MEIFHYEYKDDKIKKVYTRNRGIVDKEDYLINYPNILKCSYFINEKGQWIPTQ